MGEKKHKGKKKERGEKKRRGGWGWLIALVVGASAVTILWRVWFAGASIPYGDPEAIARGAALYAANCTSCHGQRAEGEDPFSPMGGRKPNGEILAPSLDGFGHAWHHPPEELSTVIRRGSSQPGSRMLGFEERLSEEDVRSVIAYMHSIWPKAIQQRYLTQPHH